MESVWNGESKVEGLSVSHRRPGRHARQCRRRKGDPTPSAAKRVVLRRPARAAGRDF